MVVHDHRGFAAPGGYGTPINRRDVRLHGRDGNRPYSANDRPAVPGFGGYFIEDERLKVYLTEPVRDSSAVRSNLASQLSDRAFYDESKIDVIQGQYGFLELQEWHDRIFPEVMQLPEAVYTDNQEALNRIQIGIQDTSVQAKIEKLMAEAGVPAEAVVFDITQPVGSDFDLGSAHRPLVGGLRIKGEGQGRCTLGFLARRNGQDGFVTNSHCTEEMAQLDGTVFHQPTVLGSATQIGHEALDPSAYWFVFCQKQNEPLGCRITDSAWIDLDAGVSLNQGAIARPPFFTNLWNGVDTFEITGVGAPIIGETVVRVGSKTGLQGGQVTALNVHTRNSTTGMLMLWQHKTNFGTEGGDSGGAVFSFPFYGHDVTLYGIHWGSIPGSSETVFSDIQYMMLSMELGYLEVEGP